MTFRSNYDHPHIQPFADIFRTPRRFEFFVPKRSDLHLPRGIILNTGRSTLSDDREAIRFATNTFNSGKATPESGMPDNNPLFVSPRVAAEIGLSTGDTAEVCGVEAMNSVLLPVVVSPRVKGWAVYRSFHKCTAVPVTAEREDQETKKFSVEFSTSGKSAACAESMTLLELAEEEDIDVDYSCRSGSCGECRIVLLSGEVHQDADDGLTAEEKADGYVLSCVSRPRGPCRLAL